MHNKIQYYTCPVCGYDELDESPYDKFGCSSFGICPCCGTEFGYDDATKSYEQLRKEWINGGMRWWGRTKPDDFNPVLQLSNLLGLRR